MKILHSTTELKPGSRKVCLAIGVFDGVHLGHQQIIRQTVADARRHDAIGLVLTFDRHPSVVVAPDRVPPLIYSLPQKIRAIESLGADALLLVHFDHAFSEQTGEAFVRRLAGELSRVQSICVGADFVFGYKRSGNVALLHRLGGELDFTVHGMAAVALDGQPVSSTRIREAIAMGDFDAAGQLLGRTYSLAGKVVKAEGLGHKLGFPTANLETTGLVLPPDGVYAGQVVVEGKSYRAAVNIGLRPTVQNPNAQRRVEAHLLDFSGDLYGKELEIAFAGKLRDEKKFSSLEGLKSQIAQDIRKARQMF